MVCITPAESCRKFWTQVDLMLDIPSSRQVKGPSGFSRHCQFLDLWTWQVREPSPARSRSPAPRREGIEAPSLFRVLLQSSKVSKCCSFIYIYYIYIIIHTDTHIYIYTHINTRTYVILCSQALIYNDCSTVQSSGGQVLAVFSPEAQPLIYDLMQQIREMWSTQAAQQGWPSALEFRPWYRLTWKRKQQIRWFHEIGVPPNHPL